MQNIFILNAVSKSFVTFLTLLATGSIQQPFTHKGRRYQIEQMGTYSVFRETKRTLLSNDEKLIVLVGFRLRVIQSNTIAHWVFQRICILTTPFWCGFSGFLVKLWLVNSENKNYLGMYEWSGNAYALQYCNFLLTVLKPVSVPGSVWYKIIRNQEFDHYLSVREIE